MRVLSTPCQHRPYLTFSLYIICHLYFLKQKYHLQNLFLHIYLFQNHLRYAILYLPDFFPDFTIFPSESCLKISLIFSYFFIIALKSYISPIFSGSRIIIFRISFFFIREKIAYVLRDLCSTCTLYRP